MAGVRRATLEAWAIPALYAPFFDHTYVIRHDRYGWTQGGGLPEDADKEHGPFPALVVEVNL